MVKNLISGLSILVMLTFSAAMIFAAPLSGDYPLAPRASPAEARQRVIDAAKKYEGVPYVYAGMSSRGLDCSGFICISFSDALGVTLPRQASAIHSWSEKIPLANAQPGDLLFFRTGMGTNITHVGIYLGNKQFIHAASAGAKTGVIYSSMDESYWARAFATAGRALPVAPANFTGESSRSSSSSNARQSDRDRSNKSSRKFPLLVGVGVAPTWDFYMLDEALPGVLRGFASHVSFGINFAPWLGFGVELRPEYDGSLGVFRMPLTLSWGHSEKLRFFAGPVLSFGEASLNINDDATRLYSGGTDWIGSSQVSWIGTAGVTYAPFTIKFYGNELAPYVEAAWQSYSSNSDGKNFGADFYASFRLSTGIRWRLNI